MRAHTAPSAISVHPTARAMASDSPAMSAPEQVGLGGVTGMFTAVAICPFEVLKVRLQVQSPSPGWVAEAWRVLQGQGPAGLYRGLTALIVRDVPFNGLFFGAYETICTALMRVHGVQSKDDLGTPAIFLAGGLAGCLGWSVIMPFDVAKTRLQAGQAEGRGLVSLMGHIVRHQGGVSALFVGWTAAIARAFPANAGLFAGVEFTSRCLRDV